MKAEKNIIKYFWLKYFADRLHQYMYFMKNDTNDNPHPDYK